MLEKTSQLLIKLVAASSESLKSKISLDQSFESFQIHPIHSKVIKHGHTVPFREFCCRSTKTWTYQGPYSGHFEA